MTTADEGTLVFAIAEGDKDKMLAALRDGSGNIDQDLAQKALGYTLRGGQPELVECLLRIGVDVNAAFKSGGAPVFAAIALGGLNILRILRQAGADLRVTNDIGQTTLMVAAKVGDQDIVEYLANEGVPINALDNAGRNALHWALTENDSTDLCKWLIDAGCIVSQVSNSGKTPLDYAVSMKRLRSEALLRLPSE